jgi:23S rRNA pseudouridine2605 synthase
MSSQRLTRFLALNGAASRRKSETLVTSGRVKVNNIKVIDLFYQVRPDVDEVTVDNIKLIKRDKRFYIALYKPKGYLSDLAYDDDRKLARSLIPLQQRIFPVGRLDYDSEGLILFTNDGDFGNSVIHPRYGVEREYEVKLERALTSTELKTITEGMELDDGPVRAKSARFLRKTRTHAWYTIVLAEGRNRILRRMAEKLGINVMKLKRTRIGSVTIGTLKPGQHRMLTAREVRSFVGSTQD